ncbi:MAG: GNAT family N-acetyltransferase [Variovorax sp.]|nr:MAG: GNAT family N-acetyltransferase [Variovorax sp.]
MNDADIETIERNTLAAVAPERVAEWNGWLLPFDRGTIGRAKAAVPLHHAPASPDLVDAIEARYRAEGLPCAWRIADVPAFATLVDALQGRGYVGAKPTWVQIASAQRMQRVSDASPATVDRRPDDALAALFLGEGFDPVDGASRVRALSRAPDSRYASVRDGDRTLACGTVAFGHGWASVHGMRTDAAHRGQGLAGRVLAGIAQAALAEGIDRVFLQVEAHNTAAQALYRRAGFETAWGYRYWQRAAEAR